MIKNKNISSRQLRALIITVTIGIGILTLPRDLSRLLQNDGWIAIILGALPAIVSLIFINKIFRLFPGMDIFEILNEVLGKWLSKILLIFTMIYLLVFLGYLVRNLGEITKAFLLENTPLEVIILTFILVTTYIARTDIQIVSRMAYHIYPLVLGFIIVLVLVSMPSIDMTNMLPVFQSDFTKLPNGIAASFFSYIGFEIIFLAIPFAEEKEKTLKTSLIAVGIVISIYLALFVLSLSHYGVEHLQRQTFPVLSLVKEIDLPGYFIENLDEFAIVIWIFIVFATFGPFYYSSGKVLAQLFQVKNQNLFIYPLVPFIYIVALLPHNILSLNLSLGKIINYMGTAMVIVAPILIYILGYFKLRWKKR